MFMIEITTIIHNHTHSHTLSYPLYLIRNCTQCGIWSLAAMNVFNRKYHFIVPHSHTHTHTTLQCKYTSKFSSLYSTKSRKHIYTKINAIVRAVCVRALTYVLYVYMCICREWNSVLLLRLLYFQ